MDLLDGGNGEFHEGHQEGVIETGIRRQAIHEGVKRDVNESNSVTREYASSAQKSRKE